MSSKADNRMSLFGRRRRGGTPSSRRRSPASRQSGSSAIGRLLGKPGRRRASSSAIAKLTNNPPFFVVFVVIFGLAILAGALALWLPLSSTFGHSISFVDALFTAASALSDTGLSVVTTGEQWSRFGQIVIVALIQFGGLGFMLVSSYLLIVLGKRVHLLDFRFSDAIDTSSNWENIKFALQTLLITILFEGIGVLLVYSRLVKMGASDSALWDSIFYSVSAFNNAGFSVVTGGLEWQFFNDAPSLLILSMLIIAGSTSAPVLINLAAHMRWSRLALNTKIALTFTGILLAVGTLGLLGMEFSNPGSMGYMTFPEKVLNSFFISVNARTAGFQAISFHLFSYQSLLLIMGLMFIGGVAGSTAGGVKVNTFAILLMTVRSHIMGRSKVKAFGRQIAEGNVHEAITVFTLSVLVLTAAVLALAFTEDLPRLDVAFETFSALNTVGFSTGITSSLSGAGRLILSLVMFIGRLGPLSMVLAMSERHREMGKDDAPEEAMKVA